MSSPGPIDEGELHAWADRRLPEDRRDAVSAWLDAHAEDRRRVAEWQRQNELIDLLWSPVAAEPVPRRLVHAAQGRQRWRMHGLAAAAAVALVAVGASAGWLARGSILGTSDPVDLAVTDGLLAHRMFVAEKRHAVEVPDAEEQHLVTWLSNRLDRQLKAPDLQSVGLRLMGGRLLPLCDGDPAAQLMYQDAAGARYTLFATRGPGDETPVRAVERDGIGALYWTDPEMAYAIIGSAPRDRLEAITRVVHAQLEGEPS